MRVARIALLTLGFVAPAEGGDPGPFRPALEVQAVRPERQLQALLALFDDARVSDPAAALAAWRRATRSIVGLGKPQEAALAILNPRMVRELALLDGLTLDLAFDAATGRARWFAIAPRDDGALAAAGTALALTDGGQDEPLEGLSVDRLGPPGGTVMAFDPAPGLGLILAGSRADLGEGLKRARGRQGPGGLGGAIDAGWAFRLDPARLAEAAGLPNRQVASALMGLGAQTATGVLRIEGDRLHVRVSTGLTRLLEAVPAIEPRWLEWLPARGPAVAFALAIDPATVDRIFLAADRAEKADPRFAKVAPIRTRFNLLALPFGVRPEVDFWPRLRGLSGFVALTPDGRPDATLLALHAKDEAAARALAQEVIPRLARNMAQPGEPGGALGRVRGQPLEVSQRGATVLIGLGPAAIPLAEAAARDAARSVAALTASSPGAAPQRLAFIWPGRIPGLTRPDSALASALIDAPPILWRGGQDADGFRDEISWSGLRATLKRLLERLPLEPDPGQPHGR